MMRLVCAAVMLVAVGALMVLAGANGSPRLWIIAAGISLAAGGALTTVALDMKQASLKTQWPIPMVLHCPTCGMQHIDRPGTTSEGKAWDNPPHRSHLCQGCGFVWRPADVATIGVRSVDTAGVADSIALGLVHEYAKVGMEMVKVTTTVHGPEEWGAIPELWLDCMRERDRLRAEAPPQPQAHNGFGQARGGPL